MWDWINCHLAGRHEFVVSTNTNQVCLRCLRCGRRSSGWQIAPGGDGDNHNRRSHRHYRFLGGALHFLGL